MNWIVVVTTGVGAGLGVVLGAWYGFSMDRGSDFPIAPAMTAPAGAAIGALVGSVVGAAL